MTGSGYKLKLTSKRLKSGRCQIKFTVSNKDDERTCYGYVLADAGSTLRQVVEQIEERIRCMDNPEWYHHGHLYDLGVRSMHPNNLYIYQAS